MASMATTFLYLIMVNIAKDICITDKSHENAQSSAMFTLGMILLELATLLPPSELYTDGVINEKNLQKRIEGAKIKADRMVATALPQLLELS